MENVAKTQSRDDSSRHKGINEYSLSLEKLFHAFDTFIREYSKGKLSGGFIENFDMLNQCELTIHLLWLIRHVLTHQGGVVDENCKTKYDKVFKTAMNIGVEPVIALPEELKIGSQFTIEYEDFLKVRECVFKYLEGRISEDDYKILHKRATFSDFKINEVNLLMKYPFGTVKINLPEALDYGFKFKSNTGELIPPPTATYDLENERIIIQSTGKSFPAKIIDEES